MSFSMIVWGESNKAGFDVRRSTLRPTQLYTVRSALAVERYLFFLFCFFSTNFIYDNLVDFIFSTQFAAKITTKKFWMFHNTLWIFNALVKIFVLLLSDAGPRHVSQMMFHKYIFMHIRLNENFSFQGPWPSDSIWKFSKFTNWKLALNGHFSRHVNQCRSRFVTPECSSRWLIFACGRFLAVWSHQEEISKPQKW